MPKTMPSRPTVLEVRLANTMVGTLTNLPNDQNLFAFDPAYIADSNRPCSVLASMMLTALSRRVSGQ
jgi:serine/threonine-protein kinase HipA